VPYEIVLRRSARRKLQLLPVADRTRIAEKIARLGANPDDSQLDVKALQGQPLFRLRVGRWRVIFDRQDHIKVVRVERIGARGDVYR
jgi:mRNA interferase RelE/StbE